MTSDSDMRKKVQKCLFNNLSGKIQKAKITIFETPRVCCLHLKYASHSEVQVQTKAVDIQEAKKKMLTKLPSGTLDFGWSLARIRCGRNL